jgi:hypothetical protein
MENTDWQKEFRKLDLPEQATFFVLGSIDTVFNTLSKTFQAVSDVSNNFADFTKPGASKEFGIKSLEGVLGWGLKTDKIVRPEVELKTESAAKPTAAKAIPVKIVPKAKNGDSIS